MRETLYGKISVCGVPNAGSGRSGSALSDEKSG
jgi:hypothetical protein